MQANILTLNNPRSLRFNQMSALLFGTKYLFLFIIAMAIIYFALQPREKKKAVFVLSIIYLPLVYIAAKIASCFYFDPRPFAAGHFQPLVPHIADNGFPSDHTLLSCAIASILFVYNKKLGVLAWVIAFFVGLSRVNAGLHHWIDVLGSALIAILVMALVRRYIMPRAAKTKIYQRFLAAKQRRIS